MTGAELIKKIQETGAENKHILVCDHTGKLKIANAVCTLEVEGDDYDELLLIHVVGNGEEKEVLMNE